MVRLWVVLQDAHGPEMGVLLNLGLAAGHIEGALAKLPLCCVTISRRGLGCKK